MIDLLLERAARMGVPMTPAQAEKFQIYHNMLVERNAQFNLTRVPDDLSEAIDRNYLDCAAPLAHGFPRNDTVAAPLTRNLPRVNTPFAPSVSGFPQIETAIDVGSGAGFPGIPLSILLPDTHFVLMDALGKRVDFLNDVIFALNLNAEAVHMRAEDGAKRPEYREKFDLATARAVASVNVLSEYLLPFVKVGGKMLCYKGPNLDEELAQAENALRILGGKIEKIGNANIPDRDWNHKLCWIVKIAPTPKQYPRKAGKPEKNPL